MLSRIYILLFMMLGLLLSRADVLASSTPADRDLSCCVEHGNHSQNLQDTTETEQSNESCHPCEDNADSEKDCARHCQGTSCRCVSAPIVQFLVPQQIDGAYIAVAFAKAGYLAYEESYVSSTYATIWQPPQ